jgi:DNA uptake protein ComE-like DNA-binding protein
MNGKHTINRLRALVVAPLLALVLVACGSASTGSSATSSTAPSTQPAAAAATAAPAATVAPAEPAATAASGASTAATAAGVATEPAAAKLNLNDVTEDQLLSTIPNFSNRMVREFFEYRPYISIQQFRKEIGKYVSPEQVAAYEQYVYVPVKVDESDAATLQQLPGVDENTANELIADRPYGSNQAFLAKLATFVPEADAQQAAAYLAAQ